MIECTSQVFEGLITLVEPTQSWVARWQRLDGYVGGVYAVKVVGMVSLCAVHWAGEETRDVHVGWSGWARRGVGAVHVQYWRRGGRREKENKNKNGYHKRRVLTCACVISCPMMSDRIL